MSAARRPSLRFRDSSAPYGAWFRHVARLAGGAPGPSPLMPTCLVTGGAGFLGLHLCEELLRRSNRVICVDNLETGSLANIEHLRDLDFVHLNLDIVSPYFVDEPIDLRLPPGLAGLADRLPAAAAAHAQGRLPRDPPHGLPRLDRNPFHFRHPHLHQRHRVHHGGHGRPHRAGLEDDDLHHAQRALRPRGRRHEEDRLRDLLLGRPRAGPGGLATAPRVTRTFIWRRVTGG